jgi:hypothetical protein
MCAIFCVRHIFSIKINMGTVQQYAVGDGEVFSILDLSFQRQYIAGVFSVPYAEKHREGFRLSHWCTLAGS